MIFAYVMIFLCVGFIFNCGRSLGLDDHTLVGLKETACSSSQARHHVSSVRMICSYVFELFDLEIDILPRNCCHTYFFGSMFF